MVPKRTRPRILVTIHGAGKWEGNYADSMVATIEDILQQDIDCKPAYYGEFIRRWSRGQARKLFHSTKARRLRTDFERALRKAFARSADAKRGVPFSKIRLPGIIEGPAILIQHVGGYLADPRLAEKIKKRLIANLDLAAQANAEIVLLSHSLGTVVAFDVLKEKDRQYNIGQWFTAGCPLDKLRRIGARDTQLDNIPDQVRQWINLYDKDDWVADPLHAFATAGFPVDDREIKVANGMPAAHDYFNNCKTLVTVADAFRQESTHENARRRRS